MQTVPPHDNRRDGITGCRVLNVYNVVTRVRATRAMSHMSKSTSEAHLLCYGNRLFIEKFCNAVNAPPRFHQRAACRQFLLPTAANAA